MRRVLIANRGDAALRVARAASDADLEYVLACAEDDRGGWSRREGARPLKGRGPDAYLDIAAWLVLAREAGCDAVHPGWGFLSERADFAQACGEAGLVFIGPSPEQLSLFGDKARARNYAAGLGVPVAPGSDGPVTLDEARAFLGLQAGAPVMLKAIGGGGGRGLRVVRTVDELETAYARAVSEARRGFGGEGVFIERLVAPARHIEVQVAGDGANVVALGQRDCTLQRRHQKWVEIAPATAPKGLEAAALTLARGLTNLATFEFLVDEAGAFFFIEANPRLQVEHGVTEETTGLDLVRLQFKLAEGAKLIDLGLVKPPEPRGAAIEWRLVAEGDGRLSRFRPPAGPGLRVDTAVEEGEAVALAYDPLLAKLLVRGADLADAARRSRRALSEWRIEGAPTNLDRLRALAAADLDPDSFDVGSLDRRFDSEPGVASEAGAIRAPLSGRLVEIADAGRVAAGATIAVLEAMKMEHVVAAPASGRLRTGAYRVGAHVAAGAELAFLDEIDGEAAIAATASLDLDTPRVDFTRAQARWAASADTARPAAVAKRHALNLRTARENIADLCDPGSFQEYGAFAVAAQRSRRTLEDLVANTPADGIVLGTGLVNGAAFGPDRAKTAVLAYDATVLAGTQGLRGHEKTDRLIEIAERNRLPTVLFAEGGGGRPGDTDAAIVAGLHLATFARFAGLAGRAPLIGIVAGRCFAGNAALLGCCDVIISTREANIGMGGPAMIEGGGLGVFRPEEIGPAVMQAESGVVDALVEDEAQAVGFAKAYLGYFQGPAASWRAGEPQRLRDAIPENRVRAYDMRALMRGVLDEDQMLELRSGYGAGIITALGRLEGRPIGVLANDSTHLGGAIDSEGADKAARFLRLCDAHALPILALVDTPGFMVGPEVETKGHVRRCAEMFLAAARLSVPYVAVVVRRGYGLGAMAMTGGGFHAPDLIVAWPSGEFGGMGLEGAVRLGYRRELEAAPDDAAREALFKRLLAEHYERGGAINMATALEIDAVIDPAETRLWVSRALAGARRPQRPRAATAPV